MKDRLTEIEQVYNDGMLPDRSAIQWLLAEVRRLRIRIENTDADQTRLHEILDMAETQQTRLANENEQCRQTLSETQAALVNLAQSVGQIVEVSEKTSPAKPTIGEAAPTQRSVTPADPTPKRPRGRPRTRPEKPPALTLDDSMG
jgi:hypothetical protein